MEFHEVSMFKLTEEEEINLLNSPLALAPVKMMEQKEMRREMR